MHTKVPFSIAQNTGSGWYDMVQFDGKKHSFSFILTPLSYHNMKMVMIGLFANVKSVNYSKSK